MSPTATQGGDVTSIFDIRGGSHNVDLAEEVANGLRASSPSLPSLLLWDGRGQALFDKLSQAAQYYPFHSEIAILAQYGSEIGDSVPAGGILLELGCGTIRKTKSILSSIHQQHKAVHYIALDVSEQDLRASLAQLGKLFKGSPFITMTGLLGTYNDCVAWLTGLQGIQEPRSVTIMWLGNSITNLDSQEEASEFLGRFCNACKHSGMTCQFMLSTDICERNKKVFDAYNLERPEFYDFLFNPVNAANLALGYDVLSPDDWTITGSLDERERNLVFFLTAACDVRIQLPQGGPIAISRGGRVRLITSGKWAEGSVEHICRRAGFCIPQRWKDDAGDYCIFLLRNE